MARVLFFALLAMCLVCLIQGRPEGDQAAQPNPLKGLEDAAKNGLTALQQAAQAIMNDPNVQKAYQDAAKMLAGAAQAVKEQAEAAIPKTA